MVMLSHDVDSEQLCQCNVTILYIMLQKHIYAINNLTKKRVTYKFTYFVDLFHAQTSR